MTIVDHTPLVNITLRRIPLSEELVYYIRKACASAARCMATDDDQWTVLVDGGHPERVRVDAYLVAGSGHTRMFASQSDADAFLAVRNAFSMLRPGPPEHAADESFGALVPDS